MEFSFQKLLDRLNGFGFQPGDQFGGPLRVVLVPAIQPNRILQPSAISK